MFEKGVDVQIDGVTYSLIFTTAAMGAVGKKYGGVEEMGEAMQIDKSNAVEDICWLIALLANQGIMLKTRNTNPNNPELLTAELVGLLTMPLELTQVLSQAAIKAVELGMNIEHDAGDGPVDVTLEEIRKTEKKSEASPAE